MEREEVIKKFEEMGARVKFRTSVRQSNIFRNRRWLKINNRPEIQVDRRFEIDVKKDKRGEYFDILIGDARNDKKYAYEEDGLNPVHSGRFQVLEVDQERTIRDFIQDQGIAFKTGRRFYELVRYGKKRCDRPRRERRSFELI